MADETPTAEELAHWYTPAEVLRRAAIHKGDKHAPEAVWERLRQGLIRSCGASVAQQRNYETPSIQTTPWLMPRGAWNLYKENMPDKLFTGDVRFAYEEVLTEEEAKGRTTTDVFGYKTTGALIHMSVFNLRLHPGDVDREFPSPADDPSTQVEDTKAPPVSEAALKAWADAFKLAYGGTPSDTLDMAYKSAGGAFPGKLASRDRVRAHVGGNRKTGPKGPRQT